MEIRFTAVSDLSTLKLRTCCPWTIFWLVEGLAGGISSSPKFLWHVSIFCLSLPRWIYSSNHPNYIVGKSFRTTSDLDTLSGQTDDSSSPRMVSDVSDLVLSTFPILCGFVFCFVCDLRRGPVLARLCLKKCSNLLLRTFSTRRNALCLKFLQRRRVLPFPSNYSHEKQWPTRWGKGPHHRPPQCSEKQNLKEIDQPTQLRRTCHLLPSLRQKDALRIQSRHVSFQLHFTLGIAYLMPYGSSGLPFPPPSLAGSGQLRRQIHAARLELSACSSFDAPLSSLNSGTRKPSPMLELKASLSGTKDGFFCIKKEEKLAMGPDTWPWPTQLPEDHWLLVQKEKEELAIRPVSPWDIPLRRGCAETRTVPSIQKRPQDLFPQR